MPNTKFLVKIRMPSKYVHKLIMSQKELNDLTAALGNPKAVIFTYAAESNYNAPEAGVLLLAKVESVEWREHNE